MDEFTQFWWRKSTDLREAALTARAEPENVLDFETGSLYRILVLIHDWEKAAAKRVPVDQAVIDDLLAYLMVLSFRRSQS